MNEMHVKDLLPYVAIVFTLLGLVWTYFSQILSLKEKLSEVSERLKALETKVGLFWNYVEGVVKEGLKQPIHFRKDELLDKFPDLTKEELCELKSMMLEEKGMYTISKDHKALLAAIMLAMIDERLEKEKAPCS